MKRNIFENSFNAYMMQGQSSLLWLYKGRKHKTLLPTKVKILIQEQELKGVFSVVILS
jgi:hypothetical protein